MRTTLFRTTRKLARAATLAAGGPRLPRSSTDPGPIGTSTSGGREPRDVAPVAIVGAGLAGLSTALALDDAGIPFVLFDAADRVGGRVFSDATYFDDGQVFEWYGELIDTGHAAMHGLADRFGLTMDHLPDTDPPNAAATYRFGGRWYPVRQAERDFAALWPVLQRDLETARTVSWASSTADGRALDDMSVHDWIATRVPGGHAAPLGRLLDVAVWIELNADTRSQSALNLVYMLGDQPDPEHFALFGRSDEVFKIRGGNQRLTDAMAAHLGRHRIELETALTAIRQHPEGPVELVLRRDGRCSTERFERVVLCLPFAVLAGLDHEQAGFDARKRTVIRELGRGRQSKQHLQFSRRLWREQGPRPAPGNGQTFADTGYQCTWEATRAQAGESGILVAYCGGAHADGMSSERAFAFADDQRVADDATRFLRQVEPVLPGITACWNGRSSQALPHLDPHFGCSYSYYRVGQYQRFSGYEALPQGRIHFAGEHTSVPFQGFMEGAVREGLRAAGEVVAALERRGATSH